MKDMKAQSTASGNMLDITSAGIRNTALSDHCGHEFFIKILFPPKPQLWKWHFRTKSLWLKCDARTKSGTVVPCGQLQSGEIIFFFILGQRPLFKKLHGRDVCCGDAGATEWSNRRLSLSCVWSALIPQSLNFPFITVNERVSGQHSLSWGGGPYPVTHLLSTAV